MLLARFSVSMHKAYIDNEPLDLRQQGDESAGAWQFPASVCTCLLVAEVGRSSTEGKLRLQRLMRHAEQKLYVVGRSDLPFLVNEGHCNRRHTAAPRVPIQAFS